jgi:hypothetical protein
MTIRIGILSFAHLHAESYQANLRGISGVELVGFSHENAVSYGPHCTSGGSLSLVL